MSLDAGTLNSRVTIMQLVPGQAPDGQPIETWEEVARVWANIRNLRGAEAIRADRETSTVQTSIRIRRRDDVTAAMRVEHGAVIYQIVAVLPDEFLRDKVDLVCEVVT